MAQSLAKYHARYPRYILSADEDNLIRVCGAQNSTWEENTEIQNVSLTGVAFTALAELCPMLGEIIKIQFTPPGARQMASYALVTRIDKLNSSHNIVAVHYYKMEMGHRIALAQGLSKKIREQNLYRTRKNEENIFNLKKIFSFTFYTTMWIYSFYMFLMFQHFGAELIKKFF